MSRKPVPVKADPETTGHSWDGIEEFNNPLPRWWLWTLYLTIIWGIGYVIAYPAWPLISGATPGVLGHSTRADVAAEIQRFEAANAPVEAKLVAADLSAIATDPELTNYTQNAGGAVFRTWCAQCHGSGAAGAKGYPNLLDNDWLWGGTIEDIHLTISHGVRNTTDADARFSQMPAFGDLLEPGEIDAVVNHVLAISGQEHDAALATTGATVFADNCAACHMEDGSGDRAQGAPNLTDAIWLWGGDAATLTETV
ncbi:MAG: cytochrome-c oxidase, cbb3-type subunit III, partial [Paracoccaceae bacterium]|nr:cytochrome-c oxidase, cbb3-type subunit III [Paracoccaceae bacterium]